MKIRNFVFLGLLFLIDPACTNIQMGQTAQRFYDNMHGSLRSFADITPTTANSFSFSAMGDTHIGAPGGNLFVHALQMSRADGDLFALVAGDDTNTGGESELMTFNSQVQTGGLPVYPAIGNHDIFFGGWNKYKSIIGRSIYSFNAGIVHIVVLDTANGTFGEDQLNWLRADLQRNINPIKIVMMHFPVYMGEFSSLYKLSNDEEASFFKGMMNQFGVQLVISGHYHGYGDKTLGGTRYLVIGSCNNILDIGNRPAYLKITINGSTIVANRVYLD